MAPDKRRLTVLNCYRSSTGRVPVIRLAGRWLARAGFAPGCRLEVTGRRGRLVVQVVAPPDPNWRGRGGGGMP
jgi:hypothetical protein